MKRIVVFILIICSIINPAVIFAKAAQTSYSWYCKRKVNNLQPELPAEFAFIEKYDTIWLNRKRNDTDAKRVAYLTFDAGYENGNIEKILDVLKQKEVKGAFFILENLINTNPEIVLRMQREGHLVCNHTAHHKDMSKVINEADFSNELSALERSYKELTGTELARYYRPPEGKFSEDNLKLAGSLGYKTVFWSFAYADWDNQKQPSNEYAIKKILDNMHNGAVLLLHPTSATNAQILETIIDEMRNKGYEFETLDELSREMAQN
jgi:peptidoglycan-N-acetylmuramic acid deacetylase